VSYEQEHHDWLHQVYGLRQHRDTVQDLGSVVTKEGRLLTFPNILQHQVQPFKLEDPTKPGHRKILALFLVDPHYSVISAADVPPQRHDWWAEETFGPAHELPSSTKMKELIELLPVELRDKVMDDMEDDFPITLEKAKEYREELMKERMKFQLAHDGDFSSVEISLCEH
jgi:putative lipoic acid-binding regulatory protein